MNRPNNNMWWVWAVIVGLFSFISIGIAFLLPLNVGLGIAAVSIIIFGFVLWFDPKYRYFRMGVGVLSAWLGSVSIPSVSGFVLTSELTASASLSSETGWGFNAGCAALSMLLFWLDYQLRDENSPSREISRMIRLFSAQSMQGGSGTAQSQIGDVQGRDISIVQNTIHAKSDFGLEIDEAVSFLGKGLPDVAIAKLNSLKAKRWDALSDRERYRVLANLGHAAVEKEDFETAAKNFISALKHQPEDEQALAFEAMAYFMLREPKKAREKAEAVLARYPDSEIATAVRIQTSTEAKSLDVHTSIPSHIRSLENVVLAQVHHAIARGELEEAIGYARKLLEKSENKLFAKEHLGAALVQHADLVRQGKLTARKDFVDRNIDEAIEILTDVIDGENTVGDKSKSRARYHRGFAYEARKELGLAEADLRLSVESKRSPSAMLYQVALFFARRDRFADALQHLQRIPVEERMVGSEIMRARIQIKLGSELDLDRAMEGLESLTDNFSSECELDKFEIAECMISMLSHRGMVSKIDEYLENVRGQIDEASFFTLEILANVLKGENGRIGSLGKVAFDAVSEDTPDAVVFLLANELAQSREHSLALDILKSRTQATSFEHQVRLALDCAHEVEDYRFILDLCEQLRRNGRAFNSAIDLEVITRMQLNDFEGANEVVDKSLTEDRPENFKQVLRLRRSFIGKANDDESLIEKDPKRLPPVDSVEPELGCLVAEILTETDGLVGADYAYELLRRHFENPNCHRVFVKCIGLGTGDEKQLTLPTFDRVEVGTAVLYECDSGKRWVFIEDSDCPKSILSEISPNDSLGKTLAGKTKGDVFFLGQDPIHDRRAKVLGIVHKFIGRRNEIIQEWENRFPDHAFVRTYDFGDKTKEGGIDINLFIQSMERLQEPQREIDRLIRDQPFSAGFHAKLSGTSIIESVIHLSNDDTLPLRCTSGNAEEFHASTLVDTQKVVVDGSALTTLWLTGGFKKFSALPFDGFVSEGTIRIFKKVLEDKHSRFWAGQMVAAFRGTLRLTEQSEEQIGQAKAYMKEFVDWVKDNFTICSGIAVADIPVRRRNEISEAIGEEAIETLAIAMSKQIAVWTDDLVVAHFGKELSTAGRLWTDVMLDRFLKADCIDLADATGIRLALVNAGYHYIRVEKEMITSALHDSKWDPISPPLSGIIEWLHRSEVVASGAATIAVYMIMTAYDEAPLLHQKQAVLRHVARSIAKRGDAVELLNGIDKLLAPQFRLDVYARRDCHSTIQQELSRVSRGRQVILPGDPDWGL